MSEYMSAEIWLGGRISKRLVPRLCKAIAEQNVAVDWGDSQFCPTTAVDLLSACTENSEGVRLLHLCDDQSRWGEFETLETFLRRHRIGYSRRSEGKWEYEPSRIEFRPPGRLLVFTTNHAGEVVVPVSKLLSLSKDLSKLLESPATGSPTRQHQALRAVTRRLRKALPVEIPPLGPFEFVGVCCKS